MNVSWIYYAKLLESLKFDWRIGYVKSLIKKRCPQLNDVCRLLRISSISSLFSLELDSEASKVCEKI